jgi:hypothetical protein
VGQEPLRCLRLGNQVIQLDDLLTHGLPPPRPGSIQHRGRRAQRQTQSLRNLDEGQTTELVRSVHAPSCEPLRRGHQPAFVVVTQRGRAQPEPLRSFTDRHEVHEQI